MSSWYLLIKWIHIISSTVLFGTGAGIAFFFLRAQRTGDARIIATGGEAATVRSGRSRRGATIVDCSLRARRLLLDPRGLASDAYARLGR